MTRKRRSAAARSQTARKGWETRRRNARDAAPADPAPVAPAAKPARKGLTIGPSVLGRAGPSRREARPNPFTLPQFPPRAMPPAKSGARMAMDDSSMWAGNNWQLGAIASVFAEGLAFPGYAFLAELAQRPEYRRFAEILATEMTRKWIRLSSVGDDDKTAKIKELTDAIDAYKLRDAVRRCLELDELFGRSHLYIDTGATDDRDELKTSIGSGRNEISRAKISQGSLVAFRPVEPVWVYPINYDAQDPLQPDWYEPVTWFVMGKEVHRTRLLKFVGREVPDLLKPAYSFGGLSMTQMSKPYVDNWLRTRQSVADLIHAFSVFVLKTDLETSLADGGSLLFERAELFNRLRDNRGLMILNKETEDFANVSTTIGGLEGLQAQTQEHLAAVSGIPIVKLLGIQPTGLNASDEGGIRMFYDWVAACQEKRMQAQMTSAIDFIQLSIWGEVDPEIVFAFEPLWSLDEKAGAEKREIEARTDVALIDAGVVSPEEVRKAIAADAESPFASIDVEDVPDLRTEEQEGLDPRAGGGQRGIGHPPREHLPGEGGGEAHGGAGEGAGNGEGEGEGQDADEDLSSFRGRVEARQARHARREGDFYDRVHEREERNRRGETPFHARARERSERGRDYLKNRIAGRDGEEEESDPGISSDEWKENEHPRRKDGKFGAGGSGSTPEASSESDAESGESVKDGEKDLLEYVDVGDEDNDYSDLKSNSAKWRSSLSSKERSVVFGYRDRGKFETYNDFLRGGGGSQKDAEQVNTLSKALNRGSLPDGTTLFRGIRGDFDLKVGSTFDEDGFMSMSPSSTVAAGMVEGESSGVLFKVTTEGVKGADITDSGQLPEVLVRNGSKIQISKITRTSEGIKIVEGILRSKADPYGADASDFEESKHPRDESGRFGSGGGGGGSSVGSPLAAEWAKRSEDAGLTSTFKGGKSPIIYHGIKPGHKSEGYLFVTRSKEGAAFHGKLTAYRIKPGAKIHADTETDMKHTGEQTLLDAKEANSSGIIHRSDLEPIDEPDKSAVKEK